MLTQLIWILIEVIFIIIDWICIISAKVMTVFVVIYAIFLIRRMFKTHKIVRPERRAVLITGQNRMITRLLKLIDNQ